MALRIGELCRDKGMNHFDPGYPERLGGLLIDRNVNNLEEYTLLGFCLNKNFRRVLGVVIGVRGGQLVVEKPGDSKEFKIGDVITAIGNRKLDTFTDLKVALFDLPETQTKAEVKILREDQPKSVDAPLIEDAKEVYNVRDLYDFQLEFQ
jgi:S1-C subfamily serine protease